MDTKELLQILTDAMGVTGYEDEVRQVLQSVVGPFVDGTRVDTLGNLIMHKQGKSDKVLMLDAHMDEIGLMINFIDEKGFLRFAKLGGWDDRILLCQRLTIQTSSGRKVSGVIGNLPPHLQSKEERRNVINSEDMFIDIGAQNNDDVMKMGVRVGDVATIHYPFESLTENYVTAKAFDDRAGCAVIAKCLEILKDETTEMSVTATFTIREEKGQIGARTAAYGINPDVALVIEGTIGADVPGIERRKQPVVLGEGPAISIADRLICIQRRMWEFIEKLAENNGIPYQFKMPAFSATNAGAIHSSRDGVLTGIVSVPCRYIHSPVSTMRLDDFDHTVNLVTHFIRNSHRLME